MPLDREKHREALEKFDSHLARAQSEEAVFEALYHLSQSLRPVRLWTVMGVDMEAGLARRSFSNMPKAYPTSGTKPVEFNSWFELVHDQKQCFVANTLADIARVFPDYELIGSLGCESVLNVPIVEGDELLATVNLLDGEGFFTPERVDEFAEFLVEPARRAMLAAREL